MPDMIGRAPKAIQESYSLRNVRRVKLNEERSDEDRHLAELEEHMRNARKRERRGDKEPSREASKGKGTPEEEKPSEGGHIDFTA